MVIDCRELQEGQAISMERIRKIGDKIRDADFLLFNLGWDKRWETNAYFRDYPCIDEDCIKFCNIWKFQRDWIRIFLV